LFMSRGTLMLTAGDEFGRSQQGNNNAYAQDNAITWIDWENRNRELEEFVTHLAKLRSEYEVLRGVSFLTDDDVTWLDEAGNPMDADKWSDPETRSLQLRLGDLNITLGPDEVLIEDETGEVLIRC